MKAKEALSYNAATAAARNKEKKALLGMLEFGLDAHRCTNKITGDENSGLLKSMQSAAKSHSDYSDRLMLDATKPQAARELMSAKHANGLLDGLAKQFNGIGDRIQSTIEGHERKVDNEKAMNSTTRIMLGQGALSALANAQWTEVVSYMMAGDAEIIRAMELPQAKIKFKISADPDKQAQIRKAGEIAFLDEQQHAELLESRERLESGDYLRGYFGKQYAANQAIIDSISASIVAA